MKFQTSILIVSFAVTIVLALIIIPILKKIKVGQIERDDGPKSHLKKQGTPTMGGIIFIIGIIICTIISYLYYRKIGEIDLSNRLIPMLLLTIGFGVVGFIDDFKKLVLKNTKGLNPASKMMGLFIISLMYIIFMLKFSDHRTEILIPIWKKEIVFPIYIYIPFAVLVILGTTNAINLTDGVDGLASSVCSIIITCLTVISMINNTSLVSIMGSISVGAILGFLMFNLHPAKVMMGDTGSLFLGGLISCIALYLKLPLILIIIALIPILETLSVMIQVYYYKKTGNRVFKMAPLHHHFELSGWNENKVVRVFSVITFLACVLGILMVC
ncbi:MAG TPA: phospho-N-acetylmuramoyl-pentapeptide-transferase [Clostridiales bacterium]|nr:phospho-N-acetylmuramoyl-pentapeptide-transferase [Clostridiales bacterium]